MSAHNQPTDIETKSNNAENVEMFSPQQNTFPVNGNNTATNSAKNAEKNSNSMRIFKIADNKFRKNYK